MRNYGFSSERLGVADLVGFAGKNLQVDEPHSLREG